MGTLTSVYKLYPLRWAKLLQVDPLSCWPGMVSSSCGRSDTDIPRKCGCLRIRGQTNGLPCYLQSSQRLTAKSLVSPVKSPLTPSILKGFKMRITRSSTRAALLVSRSRNTILSTTHVGVCYHYQLRKLEEGRRRAINPILSLQVYRLEGL